MFLPVFLYSNLFHFILCFAGVFMLTLIGLVVVISKMVKQRKGQDSVVDRYTRVRMENISNEEYQPSFLWEDLQDDLSLSEDAYEWTPYGRVKLIENIPCHVPFWFLEKYRVDKPANSIILYGTARTEITPHPLVEHVRWCRALETTGCVPKIHFVSGFKQYMHGSFTCFSTGYVVMENPGKSLRDLVNDSNLKSVLSKVLVAVNRIHVNGVALCNIRLDNVHLLNDRVIFSDLSCARICNEIDVLKDMTDLCSLRI